MCPLGALGPHVVCAHNVFTMCLLGIWVLVPSVSWDKVRTTLFSPKAFQVGAGRNGGVGGLRHAGEVYDEKAVG